MPADRPSIPSELKRRVLTEAGHRCAIPTCRSTPVEIAHITPWSAIKEHTYENLVALCPTCHTRFDRGEIDRKAMTHYKKALIHLNNSTKLLLAQQLDAYITYSHSISAWQSTIGEIAYSDVAEDLSEEEREDLVEECRAAAKVARTSLSRIRIIYDEDVIWHANILYLDLLSWADDVVDGLWPSAHMGATLHDIGDIAEQELRLQLAVTTETGISGDELDKMTSDTGPWLGGTGKRF
ncbi:HNH endonuclease signature motif containing protein [Nonomuraea wenchangensis]